MNIDNFHCINSSLTISHKIKSYFWELLTVNFWGKVYRYEPNGKLVCKLDRGDEILLFNSWFIGGPNLTARPSVPRGTFLSLSLFWVSGLASDSLNKSLLNRLSVDNGHNLLKYCASGFSSVNPQYDCHALWRVWSTSCMLSRRIPDETWSFHPSDHSLVTALSEMQIRWGWRRCFAYVTNELLFCGQWDISGRRGCGRWFFPMWYGLLCWKRLHNRHSNIGIPIC